MRRRSLLRATAVMAAALVPGAVIATAAPGRTRVLVIGLDGAMYAKIREARAPNLLGLVAAGTLSQISLVPHISLSGPSWATALTGVWDRKHGVTHNDFDAVPFARYPTVFTLLERAGRRTAAVATWSKIATIAGSGAPHASRIHVTAPVPDDPDEAKTDAATADAAIAALTGDAPDFLFVHLDQVDFAGHRHGAASKAYLDATTRVDREVGRIVAAVDARHDERWTVLVTTDHGHLPRGGHGGQTRDETATFVIARGPGFAPGVTDAHYALVDITPTALDLLDVPVPRGLDGGSMLARPADAREWVRSASRPGECGPLRAPVKRAVRFAPR
ncbi:alkaline phosphatase family protein [Nocardia sp. NPDC050713]|uniref:alkaline phosphatase family protein n=1 Tax=Nocardia sp. NPDC050713 TaxID=3154511 RepID=UPI00340C60C7